MTTNTFSQHEALSAFKLENPAPNFESPVHLQNINVKSESPDPLDRPRVMDYPLANSSAPSISASKLKQKEKKLRRGSLANEDKVLVSTSSPEGIAAANEITPNRIANILLKEGPLPIRHLTGHLIQQVPTFGSLSLSKQRRLIMSALESGDIELSAIFEKIGWGQWEARKVDMDIVKARIAKGELLNKQQNQAEELSPNSTSNDARVFRKRKSAPSASVRRESITNPHTEHNFKMPNSPTMVPIQNIRNSLKNYEALDEAIESSSSSFSDDDVDADEHFEGDEYADADVSMYSLNKSSPPSHVLADHQIYGRPLQQPRTSSTSLVKQPGIRSGSVSSSRRPSFVAGITKPNLPRKPRNSFTQHTIEAALDETPIERSEHRVSFSNTSAKQSFLRTKPHQIGDENAIDDEYTDEEDWEAIGANTLRKSRQSSVLTPPTPKFDPSGPAPGPNARKADEELAVSALMDMKS